MKLKKDFGVRAMLATLAGVGYYGAIGFILATCHLDLSGILAVVGMAQAPFLSAIAFYFASRIPPTS